MPKYYKKPVIVDAEQFFVDKKPWPKGVGFVHEAGDLFVLVLGVTVLPIKDGDWIVTGKTGRFPVKPDIFEQTYEKEHNA